MCRAGELSERVSHKDRASDLFLENVSVVRHDRGDAGANAIAVDQRRVTDLHAGHIGDRIQRAGLEHTGRDAYLASPRPSLRISNNPKGRGEADKTQKEESQRLPFHENEFYDRELIEKKVTL